MTDSANQKKRIVILGSGVSAMTTAFEITRVEGWQEKYDVTLYQMGWRLGGKGASGRNRKIGDRVEEHGFHLWWGYYDNAFQMIQECYQELNRPLNKPLATWGEAFKPHNTGAGAIRFNNGWHYLAQPFPQNDLRPGVTDGPPLPSIAQYVSMCINGLILLLRESQQATLNLEPSAEIEAHAKHDWWRKLLGEVESELEAAASGMSITMLKLALKLAEGAAKDQIGSEIRYKAIDAIIKVFSSTLWKGLKDEIEKKNNFEAYAFWINVDYSCAMVRGIIADNLIENGFESINDKDYRAWLLEQGAQERTVSSTITRALYDSVFAYVDGKEPSFEAGTALRIQLRMNFTYKGAWCWRMEAGMGDTIFAPLYEVLLRRGVTFKFFHRVEALHLSEDGKSIESISMARQVNIKDDKPYSPLYEVKELPCWPSEPLYEQIVEGDKLKETVFVDGLEVPKYDLESFWTSWEPVGQESLSFKKDFDLVVLGVSLASVKFLCGELLDRPGAQWDRWRNMIEHVKTVETQAFQLWLKADAAGLGWPKWPTGPALMAGLDVEGSVHGDTVDSWADLSHLLIRETWPQDKYIMNESYFAASLAGEGLDSLPPRTDHGHPHEQLKRVKQNTLKFLQEYIVTLWPNAVMEDGTFNWDLLFDLEGREGKDRINGQFIRVNIDPSQRYVLSAADTTKYRMRTDETGCENLLITGDWIYNGLNLGIVESAAMSGMLTAQIITQRYLGETCPKDIVGWPPQ